MRGEALKYHPEDAGMSPGTERVENTYRYLHRRSGEEKHAMGRDNADGATAGHRLIHTTGECALGGKKRETAVKKTGGER